MKVGWIALVLFAALCSLPLAALADESGVIVSRHEFQAADMSSTPDALTVGDYFHRFPSAAPLRIRDVPTVRMADFKVETTAGKTLHVTQKADWALAPGAHVTIHEEDGVKRLVAQDATH